MTQLKKGMKRRRFGWRRIHKWIGVVGGAFLLLWIITGVWIAIPGGGATVAFSGGPPIDVERAILSPAAALEGVRASGVGAEQVGGFALTSLAGRPVYRVNIRGEGARLIDATSGDVVTIDAAEALRIATASYRGSGTPSEPELLERHQLGYFQGPIPIYRVTFSDQQGTRIHVHPRTGELQGWDRRSTLRRYMAAFHDLWPTRPLLGGGGYVSSMVFGGLLALIVTVTGYYLAWRRGGWRWPKRRPPVDPKPTK